MAAISKTRSTKRRRKVDQPLKITSFDPLTTKVRKAFGPYQSKVNGLRFGIEFEMEGKSFPTLEEVGASTYWDRVNDNSLRGGYEFVSKGSVAERNSIAALEELKDLMAARTTRLVPSIRCSTHVHMNVQDLTVTQLSTLLTCYYILEPLLSRYNGVEREHNMFALQAQHAPSIIDDIIQRFQNRFSGEGNLKYNALNYMPLCHGGYGTLEFRAGRGINASPLELTDWLSMLTELYNVATQSERFESPSSVVTLLSGRGVSEFVEENFPTIFRNCRTLFTDAEMREMIMTAVRFAQSFAYDLDWTSYEAPKRKTRPGPSPYKEAALPAGYARNERGQIVRVGARMGAVPPQLRVNDFDIDIDALLRDNF